MKNERRYARAPVTLPLIRVDFAITTRRFDQCRATGHDRRWSASGGDPKSWYFPPQITITLLVGARQAASSSDTFALSRVIRHNIAVSNEVRYRQTYRGERRKRERESTRGEARDVEREVAARVEERVDCGQYSWQWVIRLRRFMTAARISSQFRSGLHVRTMRSKSFDLLARAICSDYRRSSYLLAKDIGWDIR